MEDFFNRLDQDILVVDDYGYDGIDFRQDPDLVLPDDEDWDASLGKKHIISLNAIFWMLFGFYNVFGVWHNKTFVYDFQIMGRYDQRGCP